ncbi:hypothetical protein HOLleu_38206 [Holothuria leucospilota]|uniref:Uncharacterized protein n=1 Tax=Holothuria leucospilota TaxID=206669 RepID=A0A9Q1BF33_HOLLE|nr:hypothetical protein HOLleu_38206 [Holothuria leucospilota]
MVKELSKKTEVDLTEDEGGLTVRVQEFCLDPDEKKRLDPVNDKAQPQMECKEVHLPDGSTYQLPEGVDLSGVDQKKAQQVADVVSKVHIYPMPPYIYVLEERHPLTRWLP